MFEADLKGADAQVVAWEANDEDLKNAFRKGVDIHAKNAEDMWGVEFTKLDPHSHAREAKRKECKSTVHGINYGCSPRTTAIQRGWLVREAERFHTRWLSLHPGILHWHNSIKAQLENNRTIKNSFGFRRVFFDRLENCFTEALAWIPQSTVAINTYHGALQLERKFWPEQQRRKLLSRPGKSGGAMCSKHMTALCFQFPSVGCPSADTIQRTSS